MLRRVHQITILAMAAMSIAMPAAAQEELQIDENAVWEHPHSGIAFPVSLGELQRAKVTQFAPDYLNLGFSYREGNDPDELSVYIYRNTNGGVPVWFEQARTSVEVRDIYAEPQLAFGTEQYAWPGAETWQGLRAVYSTPDSTYSTSTGIALFSVKGWYVKMRATSGKKTATELAQFMDAALAELTPPAAEFAQSPMVPVEECAEQLKFRKKAKDAKVDGAASMLSALLGGIVADKVQERAESDEPSEAVEWCRDAKLTPMQVAYRANASTDSYLIALGDGGLAVSVAPDTSAALLDAKSKNKKASYSVVVITDTQRINYVPQNRMPSLDRVMEIINVNRRTSTVSTWGDDSSIELNSNAL